MVLRNIGVAFSHALTLSSDDLCLSMWMTRKVHWKCGNKQERMEWKKTHQIRKKVVNKWNGDIMNSIFLLPVRKHTYDKVKEASIERTWFASLLFLFSLLTRIVYFIWILFLFWYALLTVCVSCCWKFELVTNFY